MRSALGYDLAAFEPFSGESGSGEQRDWRGSVIEREPHELFAVCRQKAFGLKRESGKDPKREIARIYALSDLSTLYCIIAL
jgi:hypothetical protein